jgi:hypothetical protein
LNIIKSWRALTVLSLKFLELNCVVSVDVGKVGWAGRPASADSPPLLLDFSPTLNPPNVSIDRGGVRIEVYVCVLA